MDEATAEQLFHQAAGAYGSGDLTAAAGLCDRLVAAMPGHPSVRRLAGMVALRQGAAPRAVEHLRVAVRGLPPDAGLQVNLGAALRAAGQSDEALEAYGQAIALAPQQPGAWFNRANLLQALGREGEAHADFERTLELAPDHAEAAHNLGALLLARQPEDAVVYLRQALRHGQPSAVAFVRLGAALRQCGDLDGAAKALGEAVKSEPTDVDARAQLASVMGEQEAWNDAVAQYRAALDMAPDRADIASNLAWTLAERGALDEALEMARRAVAADAGMPAAHYHLGLIQQRRGEMADAIAAMRQTIALAPRHVRAYSTLALLLEEVGESEEAARIAAPERHVHRYLLGELRGAPDVAILNGELVAWIRGHPTLLFDRPNRATTGGAQTLELVHETAPPLVRFRDQLERVIADDLAARAGRSELPYFAEMPPRWDLSIWAVVLSSGGYQAPHNHPSGFVSGVYYAHVPDSVAAAGEAGHIEFGASNVKDAEGRERGSDFRLTVAPREGELLLFPSYLWHRTLPFQDTQERISIAFDVVWR